MASPRPLQATVEDCLSDDDHTQGIAIGPFTPDASPGKANVRTKRSNPEDMGLGTDKTPTATGRVPNNLDGKSDSGYSSQSVAGMSSADSAASAASSQRSHRSPPAAAAVPSPTPPQKPRPAHGRQPSSQGEMRYTLPGRESRPQPPRQRPSEREPDRERDRERERDRDRQRERERRSNPAPPPPPAPTQKRRDSRIGEPECTKPGCTKCGPDAVDPRPRPARRQSMLHTPPADSAPDVSYNPHVYDTRSQVSDPAQYPASSPREGRPPRTYQNAPGGPVLQPAITRRLSTSGRPPRPTSYHGEVPHIWPQSGMHSPHPGSPYEHGPPPSRSSAWGHLPYPQPPMNAPYMPPYHPPGPPSAAFYQAQQMQPPRDQQRPPLQARAPTYGYPPAPPVVPAMPVMQVGRTDRHMPSARYHSNALPSVTTRQPQRIDYGNQEEDESDTGSETESDEEPERPPQRASRGQRPGLRHANTTPAPPMPELKRPQTIVIPDPRNSRASDRNRDPRPARRTSTSRPPLVPSRKAQSAYDTPQARVLVEGSRSSRRGSNQVYERTVPDHRRQRQHEYNEAARSKRSSKVYDTVANGVDYERDFYDDEEEAEHVLRAPRHRRDTDVESRRRPHRPLEVRQAQADAEDYINAKRGGGEALADVSYEVAKNRSSRTSGPSEAESSRSRGSDNNGAIRFRIGNDAPVIFKLDGDMDGRIVQLLPAENGMNELVISSNGRGGESTYRSENRSVRSERRAITSASQARRDAEEMTERSSESSRRRRETRGESDEPRRVLHRPNRRRDREETKYQY